MHCPNCANESDLDQKFCRKCGFNLEPITKVIRAGHADDDATKLEKVERDKVLLRRMVSWMSWGMLLIMIGIIVIVVNKQLNLDRLVGLIGSLIALGGASVAAYGLLDAMRGGCLKTPKPKAMTESTTTDIKQASTTRELEGRLPIPLGSVTERTTQLISLDSDQHS